MGKNSGMLKPDETVRLNCRLSRTHPALRDQISKEDMKSFIKKYKDLDPITKTIIILTIPIFVPLRFIRIIFLSVNSFWIDVEQDAIKKQ